MKHRLVPRLGIKHLLAIGFSLVVALMVSIAALANYQLTTTSAHLQNLLSNQAQAAATVRDITAGISDSYIAALSAAVASTPDDAKYQKDAMKAAHLRGTQAEDKLRQLLTPLGGATPLLADLDQVRQYRTQAESSVSQMDMQMGVAEAREALISNIAYSAQPLFASWQDAAIKLEARLATKAEQDSTAARNDVERKRWLFLMIAGTGVLCALGSGWLVARAVGEPVKDALALAENVAQGRLSHTPTRSHGGEIGAIVDALTRMQHSLRTLVRQVYASTEGIVDASREIAAGNENLSNRTETTVGHLQVATRSMQQLTDTVRQTAMTAEDANRLASQAAQAAVRGGAVVQQVVDSMKGISQSSARIGEITGMIDAIAFQTNILALNAAVEAARASEHGRGFAVVAGEVRSLAHRSATAAREIKELIAGSLEKVTSGSRLVEDAGRTMSEIVSSVQSASSLIAEISGATSGQSGELSHVHHSVAQLDDMTRQNSALVEQTTSASASLSDQARRLQEIVAVFELSEDDDGPDPTKAHTDAVHS